MVDEISGWATRLPERSRYGIVSALRQTLSAAERWGYMSPNPAKLAGPNRQPPPGPIRASTLAELDAIAAVPDAACVRRRDRAAPGGVGAARAPGRRPPDGRRQRPPHRVRRRGRRAGQDGREPPAGAALTQGGRRARGAASEARHAAAVAGAGGAGCSASTTSAPASGGQPSRRPGSQNRPACTTCARRSLPNALAAA